MDAPFTAKDARIIAERSQKRINDKNFGRTIPAINAAILRLSNEGLFSCETDVDAEIMDRVVNHLRDRGFKIYQNSNSCRITIMWN